jgi:DNA repair exonuclease SbcCD nuclease subunit
VDCCLARKPTLLLIAGDLIDHWIRDYQLGLRLIHELSRLEYSGTQVFWVRGNHDAENRVISALLLPEHVSELGLTGVEVRPIDSLGLMLVGRSYPKRCTEENLFAEYPHPKPGITHIGLLHTSADGATTKDRYAPCGRRQLSASGYDYLALGHVHEPQVLSDKTTVVAYSGCLQGRNFDESGPRGCQLVTFENGHVTKVEHEPLDVVRFGKIDVDVSTATSVDDVLAHIEARCRVTLRHLPNLGLVVRIKLSGQRGLECLQSCSEKLRSHCLRHVADLLSERFTVDGFWAESPAPDAPSLRLDSERDVTRLDL